MGKSQMFIPIAPAGSSGSSCSSGASSPKGISSGACSSAASCSSASSCSSAGAADSNDPTARLAQEGWVLRTTIGEPRLSEVVSNYRAMGYEVHVEMFGTSSADSQGSQGGSACTTCYDAADKSDASQGWGSVYVRPGQPTGERDELF
jgi:hypothetical protein